MEKDLNHYLDNFSVLEPGHPDSKGPMGWWGFCNEDGIVAYFSTEKAAFRFRLAEINRELNG